MDIEEVYDDLIMNYTYDDVREQLDNYYTDYDCKIIEKRLKTYAMNREICYLTHTYNYSFQQAIDRLLDLNILRLW